MKTIEIIVTQEGKTTVRTAGFHGSSCREVSRFIEQARRSCPGCGEDAVIF